MTTDYSTIEEAIANRSIVCQTVCKRWERYYTSVFNKKFIQKHYTDLSHFWVADLPPMVETRSKIKETTNKPMIRIKDFFVFGN